MSIWTKLFRGAVFAASLMVCAPSFAGAADGAGNYDGFYLGGTLGGYFGSDMTAYRTNPDDYSTKLGVGNVNGFIGGLTAGCNHACESYLIGVEIDGSYLSGDETGTEGFDGHNTRFELNSLFTGRVRLGVPIDYCWNPMVFVTGGFAGAGAMVKTPDTDGDDVGSDNGWLFGWTVGAGVEAMPFECYNISVKLEYLYVSLSNATFRVHEWWDDSDVSNTVRAGTDLHVVRVGANWFF